MSKSGRKCYPPFTLTSYDVRTATYILLSVLAIKIRSPRFHAAFAVFAVTVEVIYILKLYLTIG